MGSRADIAFIKLFQEPGLLKVIASMLLTGNAEEFQQKHHFQ